MATIQRQAPNGKIIEFDDTWSEEEISKYLQLPEYQPKNRSLMGDIGISAVDGVRDAAQSTIGLIEGIGDTLGEKTNIGGFVFGKDAENGIMGYENYETWKAKGREDLLFGKAGVKDAIELPDFEGDPQTIAGGLTKGVSQFLTGWFTGGKVLKGVKFATGGYKGVSPFLRAGTTGQVTKTMAQCGIADFTAFDEETGRLADMVNEHAPFLQNPLFDYLSSDPDDTFYEARFKNALEGAGIGASVEAIVRTFRYIKNINKSRNKEKINQKQLEEDEKFLKDLDDDSIIQTKYKPVSPVEAKALTKNLDTELEDSIFNQFKEAQKTTKNKKEFDKKLDNLDLNLNFNVRQFINLDKDGLLSINAFNKAYKNLVKKKKIILSDDYVRQTARKLYENNAGKLEIDVKKLENLIEKAPYQVVALNSYIETLSNGMKRIARVSKRDKLAEKLLVKSLLPKWKLAMETKSSILTGVGRTLRLAGTTTGKPIIGDLDKVIKEFDEYGGDVRTLVKQIGRAGDTDVTNVLNYAFANKTWDVLNEVWINALLSNPKTHIINTTSNLVNIFIRPLEKMIGSRMATSLLENPAKVAKLRLEGQKAFSSYAGMRRYAIEALKYAKLSLKKEDTIISRRSKIDMPEKAIQKTKLVKNKKTGLDEEVLDWDSASGVLINAAGKFIRIPTRFLGAEDEFFRQIVYRMELEKEILGKGIKLGKSKTKVVGKLENGKPITEFDQFVREEFEKGFDEFGRGVNPKAMRKAEEGTYTQELNGVFKRFQAMANDYPIIKQIIPFVRTPVNLMLNVVDRTPLGFVRKNFRDDFFGRNGAERMAQARGGLATGYVLMTLASIMHREGMITGSQGQITGERATKSRDLKDLRKQTGALPYAFRYWDEEAGTYKYRQFGRFDPFGAFFGIVADFHDVYDQLSEKELQIVGSDLLILAARQGGDTGEYISPASKIINTGRASVAAMQRNLISKTYLKGLADFMEVLTDDSSSNEKWDYYWRNKLGSFVPNVYTKFVNDPFYRDVRTILDVAKKRGVASGEVEHKYDFRGNALKYQGSETKRLIDGLFNPFGSTEKIDDPVAEEILRLGINMPTMKRELNGDIDLSFFVTDEGQTAYNKQMQHLRNVRINGKSLDQALREQINSNEYKMGSDPYQTDENVSDTGSRAKQLRRIIKSYHNAVEQQILKDRKKFRSIKDDTGNFTLDNSIQAYNNNKTKINMGVQIQNSDMEALYQFSK